ncbi:MAG: efflux transporter outer membrane subunit [Bryobacterales bacterium]|nr:efflux transporter outer membrane subunit [Bryobacterales bacterium]
MRFRLPAVLSALLIASCSKPVQLPVHQFNVPAPEIWQGAATDPVVPDSDWWAHLDDAGLGSAIRKALDCSQSLRAAAARIEIAAQERLIVGASDWPEISIGVARARQRQNFVGLPFPGLSDRVLKSTYSTAGLTFNIAWEADLWNRLSSQKLAADAGIAASEADRLAVRLSLSGQVAKAWFAAVEAHGQVEAARAVAEHLKAVAEWTRDHYRHGSRSLVDVRVAESDIERAESAVREQERARDLFVRQVEVLACEYPAGERVPGAELPGLPPPVPAGLPSELVERRPDLLAAGQALLGADARIVQARAALRPSFALTTAAGSASNKLLDLVNPNLQAWNYALGLAQPIFNRGRLKANVRATEARAREAAANYESLLWNAYLEVESALASEETFRNQQSALRDSQRTTRQAIELAEQRFAAGIGDIFSILALQRSVLETESALLALQRARIDNRVDLHLALGGSFEDSPSFQPGRPP